MFDLEQRRASREMRSSAYWFKEPDDHEYHHGWLVERSDCGVAFLTRSEDQVHPGMKVVATMYDPWLDPGPTEMGIVNRVKPVHGDLWLAAIELKGDSNETSFVKEAAEIEDGAWICG